MTPVFFHAPKCGGTYAISWQLLFLNHFLKEGGFQTSPLFARNVELRVAGKTMARVLGVGDCSRFQKGDDPTHFFAPLEEFKKVECFHIFSVIIEPRGFRKWREILSGLKLKNVLKWMLVRHPYEVARSFFNYMNSPVSAHEVTARPLSQSLPEYIASMEVCDSWLIRNFLDLQDSEAVGDFELERTQEMLADFKIKDISLVLSLLDSVYQECYGITSLDITERAKQYIHFNASSGPKVHFEDLPAEARSVFLARAEYDLKLYGWAVN